MWSEFNGMINLYNGMDQMKKNGRENMTYQIHWQMIHFFMGIRVMVWMLPKYEQICICTELQKMRFQMKIWNRSTCNSVDGRRIYGSFFTTSHKNEKEIKVASNSYHNCDRGSNGDRCLEAPRTTLDHPRRSMLKTTERHWNRWDPIFILHHSPPPCRG